MIKLFSNDIKKGLKNLERFQTTEKQVKEEYLDPDYLSWRDDPAEQQQIRYMYVLIKKMGMTPQEALYEWDFHHMTKGEISDLINECLKELGEYNPDDDWSNRNKQSKGNWKNKVRENSSNDDDIPFF